MASGVIISAAMIRSPSFSRSSSSTTTIMRPLRSSRMASLTRSKADCSRVTATPLIAPEPHRDVVSCRLGPWNLAALCLDDLAKPSPLRLEDAREHWFQIGRDPGRKLHLRQNVLFEVDPWRDFN